jgi:hypothetical protein
MRIEQIRTSGDRKSVEMAAKTGRPTKYSEEIADKICAGLMAGYGLKKVCSADGFPSMATIFNWLQNKDLGFLERYEEARRIQAELLADELVEISDERPTHEVPDPDGGVSSRVDGAGVQRNRLRVDTRKWIASKLLAKKYGDKIQAEVSGTDGGPIQAAIAVTFVRTNATDQG